MQKHQTIIPKGEIPEKMPSGLQELYTFGPFEDDDGERLTEENLKKILKKIRNSQKFSLFLGPDSYLDLEGKYMHIEVDDGCIAFQYVVDDGSENGYFCCCFDPDYLDSDEESPMVPGDGQSIILKRYIMHDLALAADCVEYFSRTGALYPGMAWLKEYTSWYDDTPESSPEKEA